MIDPALAALAREHGVQTEFTDVAGRRHEASAEALLAVLRLLGAPVRGAADAEAALAARRAERERPGLPPVAVFRDGTPPHIPVRGGGVRGVLHLEEGGEIALVPDPAGEGSLVPAGPVPHGYHRAVAETPGECLVIAAPARAFGDDGERTTSLFLPLYALRTARDWGAGDFTDLAALTAFARGRGVDSVGVLPLDAAFLDEPCEPSPYSPASRLFWNELYVDAERAPEIGLSPEARQVLASADFAREREALRALPFADPRRLMALKRRVLAPLARAFERAPAARRKAFAAYLAARPEAEAYARFRAAVEKRRAPWTAWAGPARDGALGEDDADPAAVRYHLYVQFLAEEQLRAAALAGARLALDLPLGAASDSFDVWRHRDLFAVGAAGGAPPDDLCATGQNWGFPPLHPESNRRDGYRYWRACLHHHMAHAASLRVDHVMGFHRLFWVPDGLGASEGVYVEYPADEYYAVLALESHRARCRVVGENLGTVPPAVNERLRAEGIRGMYVLPFEMRGGRPNAVPPGIQAALGTHDTPAFAVWRRGLAPAESRYLSMHLREEGEAGKDPLAAALSLLAGSEAGDVVVSLEDLLLEERPQNVPGTGPERMNFRRRAARPLEEIAADEGVRALLAAVVRARTAEGRAERAGRRPPAVLPASRFTPEDAWLLAEGTHTALGDVLGAHPGVVDGLAGAFFAVWAPNAGSVSVIGDFNCWESGRHPLAPQGSSGVHAGFIPGVVPGDVYKYHLRSRVNGYVVEKADPFAAFAEIPPRTGSVVWDTSYEWGDAEWMATRAGRSAHDAPVSVYEVHLGSWRRVPEEGDRWLTYREMAPHLVAHLREQGFTHVEFLPVMEHPLYESWGYQVLGYFAPTSRYGSPQDFMYLVDTLHREGFGVILDWVPSHYPRDTHGLSFFDGTHLFEHADPRQGVHPDWDSILYNYGRHEVRAFLVSAALHWLRRYHADGLRTDAVASMLYLDYSRKAGEWLPNVYGGREHLEAIDLLRRFNEQAYVQCAGVQTYAEESTAWPGVSRPTSAGGLGFGYKWDMGWMHDTLSYFARDPIHRRYHHGEITFRMIYAFTENYVLSLSHDEVVHGKRSLVEKMPGDDWRKFANLRLLYAYMWAQSGKKLLFMGGEFAQRREWNVNASLDWHLLQYEPHRGIRDLVAGLNRLYRDRPALHQQDCEPAGFSWVTHEDADASVMAFLRKGRDPAEVVMAAFHFTPLVREGYRLGVPGPGSWKVILNTDDGRFGGSGAGSTGRLEAEPLPAPGGPYSIAVTLPPLGALYLEPIR